MPANYDRYKSDLTKLTNLGKAMLSDIMYRHIATTRELTAEEQEAAGKVHNNFEDKYQRWYTESLALIRQLAPDRRDEFEILYRGEGKRRQIEGANYNIQDWLNGVRAPTVRGFPAKKLFDDFAGAAMRFKTQQDILEAISARFDSTLFDIRQLVQADLFDSELEAARELAKNGYLRGAGVVAGVLLEKHLAQALANHRLSTRKQHPTIGDLNDALKNENVIDVPMWRAIQRLGDLRNMAAHSKQRQATTEEISELIDGVDKITKTLF